MVSTAQLKPVIECVSLSKVFQDFWGRDKVQAVSDLNLEILPGEIFGLLGPNGSGKTTTIKMLLGLLYPTKGAARVFGRPPTETAVKARIGFMPEESYLYRYLNAYETLDYYGRLFKQDRVERRRRTGQLIDMVGLKRAAKRPVGTYSKGMARRVGLAQALINDPDLLILDEPTTGLDPIGSRQIKDVIRLLGDRGKTVLLCSHLLADVEDVCHRVCIMYGGTRRALGPVDQLLRRQDITQITTDRLDDATVQKVRDLVTHGGQSVRRVDHPADRLEDLFLRVVGEAQRERLETSGAESTAGAAEFLGGTSSSGSVLDALVAAGRETTREAAPEKAATDAPTRTRPRDDVLSKLTAVEPAPAAPAKGDGPVETKLPSKEPDRALLDQLTQKSRKKDGA